MPANHVKNRQIPSIIWIEGTANTQWHKCPRLFVFMVATHACIIIVFLLVFSHLSAFIYELYVSQDHRIHHVCRWGQSWRLSLLSLHPSHRTHSTLLLSQNQLSLSLTLSLNQLSLSLTLSPNQLSLSLTLYIYVCYLSPSLSLPLSISFSLFACINVYIPIDSIPPSMFYSSLSSSLALSLFLTLNLLLISLTRSLNNLFLLFFVYFSPPPPLSLPYLSLSSPPPLSLSPSLLTSHLPRFPVMARTTVSTSLSTGNQDTPLPLTPPQVTIHRRGKAVAVSLNWALG